MGLKAKITAVAGAVVLAGSLMGFAPVPNTTTYQGQYLFSEDGSEVVVHAAGHTYKVAEIPVTKINQETNGHAHYRGSIVILGKHGKILFFKVVSTPKAVNAYGAFFERKKKSYTSLNALKHVVTKDINNAHNGY